MSNSNLITDTFGLNGTNLFHRVRESLPFGDKNVTQNLIECRDDLIFAWDSEKSCVLVLNWRAAKVQGENVKYQSLLPSSTNNFIVNRILPSHDTTYLALSGSHGISIIELPRRWGRNGQYRGGDEEIICRSFNLDESFFALNSHFEVLQIRWHPASPSDLHLLVLMSNNTIRVYDEFTLKHVWRIGPTPCNLPPKDGVMLFLDSLGDIATDFDICPPRVVTWTDESKSIMNASNIVTDSHNTSTKMYQNSTSVIWPLIILRGNGSIFVLCAGVDSAKPRLQGPLSMTPSNYENYGDKFCSILVLPSTPPTIILAENTGRLHHALLMELDEDRDLTFDDGNFDNSVQIYPSDWDLQVLEIVEIELGLQWKANTSQKCPIFLKADLLQDFRYFAYHNMGLHSITVNFIKELQNYVNSEVIAEKPPSFGSSSKLEYIVCTKALESTDVNPVLGLTFFQSPSGIGLLLASGQMVTLDLITDTTMLFEFNPQAQGSEPALMESPLKTTLKEPFQNYIANILQSGISQPILKLGQTKEPTSQEAYTLLTQATDVLQKHYFAKFERASQEIQKRVKTLQILKEKQKQDLEALEQKKTEIRVNAERLAEKYDDAYERQKTLFKRAIELVRVAASAMPHMSTNEKEFANQIRKINTLTNTLAKQIEHMKRKVEAQQTLNEKWSKKSEGKKLVLPAKQEEIIKEIIVEVSTELREQIAECKKMNQLVNIS